MLTHARKQQKQPTKTTHQKRQQKPTIKNNKTATKKWHQPKPTNDQRVNERHLQSRTNNPTNKRRERDKRTRSPAPSHRTNHKRTNGQEQSTSSPHTVARIGKAQPAWTHVQHASASLNGVLACCCWFVRPPCECAAWARG